MRIDCKRFTDEMLKQGLSSYRVAKLAGVATSTVSRLNYYEQMSKPISFRVVSALARALQIDPQELIRKD